MKRRLAREIAIQSLYQIEMNDVTVDEAIAILIEEAKNDNEIRTQISELAGTEAFINDLVKGVNVQKQSLDEQITLALTGWNMDRLSRVDRQILRIAVYELENHREIPVKVVINEAIELAKHFGREENGKFVNGVLGKWLKLRDIKAPRGE